MGINAAMDGVRMSDLSGRKMVSGDLYFMEVCPPTPPEVLRARAHLLEAERSFKGDGRLYRTEIAQAAIVGAMLSYAAEREAAAYARAAEVARGWKSPLRPGSAIRLAGHNEAARDIATAIEALGEAKG